MNALFEFRWSTQKLSVPWSVCISYSIKRPRIFQGIQQYFINSSPAPAQPPRDTPIAVPLPASPDSATLVNIGTSRLDLWLCPRVDPHLPDSDIYKLFQLGGPSYSQKPRKKPTSLWMIFSPWCLHIWLLNNKFYGLSPSLFDQGFQKIAGRDWSEHHLTVIRMPSDGTLYQWDCT